MTTNVLLVSAGIFHPPQLGRFRLRLMLSKLQDFSILHLPNMETLPQLDLGYFQGLILYYHQHRISEMALDTFESFIRSGGGVLAIHSATASFHDSPRYFKILGGRFREHGPVETFEVLASQEEDPIFGGLPGFTTKDELYLHDLAGDFRIHYFTPYRDEPAPMVWTRNHGRGRVCYTCPGHRSATMGIPEYQAILRRALRWVCGLS